MSRYPYVKRAGSGFTLIEVLVVVAIIALLISILLPSLRTAREEAKSVVCMSDLKQLMFGIHMYQTDHQGYLPGNVWSEYDWSIAKQNLWFYKLAKKYQPNPKIYICPSDPFGPRFDFEAKKTVGSTVVMRANTAVPSVGYGMNYLVRHFADPYSFNIEKFPPKRPMNTILLAEVGPDHMLPVTPLGGGLPGQAWRDGGRLVWDDGARGWYTGPTWLTARHVGRINVSTMGGSVQRASTAKLLRPRTIKPKYDDCARGDCYFCNYHSGGDATHYNFSKDKLWWWTGKYPQYPK